LLVSVILHIDSAGHDPAFLFVDLETISFDRREMVLNADH
jgi:hypothetical protein